MAQPKPVDPVPGSAATPAGGRPHQPRLTHFTLQALSLSQGFWLEFAAQAPPVRGGNGYRLELSTPDGLTTYGGKQAVQQVRLVEEGGGTLVAGTINHETDTAQLRTYHSLSALHAARFGGARLPIDEAGYEQHLSRFEKFFTRRGFRVVRVEAPIPTLNLPSVAPRTAHLTLATRTVGLLMGLGVSLALAGLALAAGW